MKKFFCTIFLSPLAFSVLTLQPAQAQTGDRSISTLYNELQTAVCFNDWDEALSLLTPMISSSEITANYRTELIRFRQQVQDWRASNTEFSDHPNCGSTPATGTEAEISQHPAPDQTPTHIEVIQPTDSSPRTSFTTRPTAPSNSQADTEQCQELANVMNWAGSQAESMLSQANFSDINSLVGMLTNLARVSEQAANHLQTVQLTDRQLQTFQRSFISVYQRFDQVTGAFVSSANAEAFDTMEQQNAQLQNLAEQEFSLINQVNSYCGSEVITIQGNS
ncbi:MAG: hypothetical protein VKL39_05480 [Leptolyngbyaceae bacterium]|nr:hypothetical protein [Leptolyngbyaceae bacterium]